MEGAVTGEERAEARALQAVTAAVMAATRDENVDVVVEEDAGGVAVATAGQVQSA